MKAQSSIIYSGPSLLDGAPIVVVAIIGSTNRKTGPMIQTHIIRADMSPLEASRTGKDASICGDCRHRGQPSETGKIARQRSCYVNLAQGPLVVWKAFQAGKYPQASSPEEIAQVGAGRMVRLGSYGDPAAVPAQVWQALTSKAKGWTGYSHQPGKPGYSPEMMMASADSQEEASGYHAKGYRTFRVIPLREYSPENPAASLMQNEIMCPSSRGVLCEDCGLCKGGNIGKNIAIPAHGIGRGFI